MTHKTRQVKPYHSSNGRQATFLSKDLAFDVDPATTAESVDPAVLAEVWARRAQALAEAPPVAATGQTVNLLIFWLGHERYGIEVTHVREIYPLEQLTPVPRTPNFVAGVFSARGRILSVIDLRAFLGLTPHTSVKEARRASDQAKIMVVANTHPTSELAHLEVGLLADEVTEVVTVFKDDLEPALTTQAGSRDDYIQGITADMLIALNLNALLNDKRLIVHEELM